MPCPPPGESIATPTSSTLRKFGVHHLRAHDDLRRIQRIPAHADERDLHGHELAIRRDGAIADDEPAIGQLHNWMQRMNRIRPQDPAQTGGPGQVDEVPLVPERHG